MGQTIPTPVVEEQPSSSEMSSEVRDWQDVCSEVTDRLEYVLSNETLADCTFAVGPEAKHIRAHRLILSTASPVFYAMLNGSLAEGDGPICVPDIEPETFDRMLKYIYTNVVMFESYKSTYELYAAAKKYILCNLETRCMQYLNSNITPTNVCELYEFSELYQDIILKESSLEHIRNSTWEILSVDQFKNIKLQTLITICSEKVLNVMSELELFKAIEIYAEHNSLSSSSNASPSIRDAIQQIRFLTLTPEEFAQGPGLSGLLTESEGFTILMKLLQKPGNNYNMLDGFSLSTERRYNRLYARRSCKFDYNDFKMGDQVFVTSFKVNESIQLLGVELSTGICKEKSFMETITIEIRDSNSVLATGKLEKIMSLVNGFIYTTYLDKPLCINCNQQYTVQIKRHTKGECMVKYLVNSTSGKRVEIVKNELLTFEFTDKTTSPLRSLIYV